MSASTRKVSVALHNKIRRLFDQLNGATKIETLRVPPGNNLEKLKGNLKNYWSIRANGLRIYIFQKCRRKILCHSRFAKQRSLHNNTSLFSQKLFLFDAFYSVCNNR